MAKRDDCWFATDDIARAFGIQSISWSNGLGKRVRAEHPEWHEPGESPRDTGWWLFPQILKWHVDREVAKRAERFTGDDADLYGGSDSPELRRLRRVRAEREELKLATERGEMVNVANVRKLLEAWISRVRNSLDAVQRHHGREAYDRIIEAMDEGDRHVRGLSNDDG
jgi:hypothetical protein